jgi:hypothetical protein
MNSHEFVNQYGRYINSLERSLVVLRSDFEHLAHDGRIVYALDFSELFYYLHPFADMYIEKTITPIPGEKINDALTREQIALNFAINHLNATKVLLPPYLVELRDHIRLLRNNVTLSSTKKREMFEVYIVNAILQNTQYPTLRDLVAKTNDLKNIDKQNLKDFLEFVKSDFKPLYLALTLSPSEIQRLIETIGRLFRTGKINDYYTIFSETDDQFEKIKSVGHKWFDLLRQKISQQKDYARHLDGLALAYIDIITNNLSLKGEKFIFITRSQRMVKVFNSTTPASSALRKAKKGEFRDLDYLMTYLRFSRHSYSEALSEVNAAIETIVQIKKGLRYAKKYTDEQDISFLEKEIIALSNSKENLSIALGNKGANIEREIVPFLNLSETQMGVLQRIYMVVTENPFLAKSLQAESRIVSTTITQQFNYLRLFTEKDEIERIARSVSSTITGSGTIELHPLRSELPIEMSFEDPQIIRLTRRIIGKVDSTRNIKKWRRTVHTLLNDSSGKTEIVILRSYLFALLDSYEAAFDEIEIGLHKGPPQNILREMLLLKMMYARKTKKTIEGIQCFMENHEIAEKDPRLVREFSVLIWQSVKSHEIEPNDAVISSIERLIGRVPSVEFATELVRGILKEKMSDSLRAQSLNSLSYYLAEQYYLHKKFENLDQARNTIEELRNRWPMEKWISRFHHTNGWIAYLYAEAKIDQIVNLQKAVQSIMIALRDKHAPKGEIAIWRQHLKIAKRLLKEIELGYTMQAEGTHIL